MFLRIFNENISQSSLGTVQFCSNGFQSVAEENCKRYFKNLKIVTH